METQEQTAKEQFTSDFLLVADNNFEMYQELREKANELSIVELSDHIRENYEKLVEQVIELVNGQISEVAGELIGQLLAGWGIAPFDDIARELKGRK